MSNLSISEKASRVTVFVIALRIPEVAGALGEFGFDERDRREGYARLSALTAGQLEPAIARTDPRALAAIDAWENRWFPIVHATLRFRFPAVHARVLGNLRQTDGSEVIVSVGELLRRLDVEAASSDPESEAALALLATRGLTADVRAEAAALLAGITTGPLPVAAAPARDHDALATSEQALWEWYLEWGEIARVAIADRRLLRRLGFRRRRRPTPVVDQAEADFVDAIEDLFELDEMGTAD